MADVFQRFPTNLESPAKHAAAVTPNDSTDLTVASRGLYVGGSGDVRVIMVGGETVTFTSASGFMPIRVSRVLSTGTTATGIVAIW